MRKPNVGTYGDSQDLCTRQPGVRSCVAVEVGRFSSGPAGTDRHLRPLLVNSVAGDGWCQGGCGGGYAQVAYRSKFARLYRYKARGYCVCGGLLGLGLRAAAGTMKA